jgi:hypothetical protein
LMHGWGPWRKRWHDVPICVGKKGMRFFRLWSTHFLTCLMHFKSLYMRCFCLKQFVSVNARAWFFGHAQIEKCFSQSRRSCV